MRETSWPWAEELNEDNDSSNKVRIYTRAAETLYVLFLFNGLDCIQMKKDSKTLRKYAVFPAF